MSKFILDCGAPSAGSSETACTLTPYSSPPATQDVYSFTPGISYFVAAAVLVAAIIATATVRFRRHERLERESSDKESTRRIEVQQKHANCPTCGTVYVPESSGKVK